MNICITGATGFLGHALSLKLLQAGHDLTIVTRSTKDLYARFPYPCTAVEWKDISDPFPEEALKKCQGVIHLLGESIAEKRWSQKQKDQILKSRIDSSKNLAEAIRKVPTGQIQFLISASAIGYYGDRGDEELDEKSGPPGEPDFLAEVCALWEKTLAEEISTTRLVFLRTGMVLGREGGAFRKLLPVFEKFGGGPLGTGKQWMSWIHLEDWTRAVLHCIDRTELSGPVLLTAPEPVRNKDFGKEVARSIGVIAPLTTPAFVLRIALGEFSHALLGSQKTLPQKLLNSGFSFQFKSLSSALVNLIGPDPKARIFLQSAYVPQTIDTVFEFFSHEQNLERITPAWVHFHVVGKSTEKIESGTVLDYRLRIHGIPVSWQSKIEEFLPPHRFKDIQVKGPYRSWIHEHRFSPLKGGTLIEDEVHYSLPMGALGAAVSGEMVRKDISEIFHHRLKIMHEIFK